MTLDQYLGLIPLSILALTALFTFVRDTRQVKGQSKAIDRLRHTLADLPNLKSGDVDVIIIVVQEKNDGKHS